MHGHRLLWFCHLNFFKFNFHFILKNVWTLLIKLLTHRGQVRRWDEWDGLCFRSLGGLGRPPLAEWRFGPPPPTQLASTVGRGCKGRNLHFASGHVFVFEYIRGHVATSILLFLWRENMTKQGLRFRDMATMPVPVVILGAINQHSLQLHLQ